MATLTFNIPDAIAPRVLNSLCKAHGYSALLANGTPNPETKIQFLKRKMIEYVLDGVIIAEIQPARKSAEQSVRDEVKTNVVIT